MFFFFNTELVGRVPELSKKNKTCICIQKNGIFINIYYKLFTIKLVGNSAKVLNPKLRKFVECVTEN